MFIFFAYPYAYDYNCFRRRPFIKIDGLKERIRYCVEWIRLLWVGMFIIGGGTVSLLFKLDTLLKIILFALGILIEMIFAIIIVITHRKVDILIKELEEMQ